jgi:hypothetical protein
MNVISVSRSYEEGSVTMIEPYSAQEEIPDRTRAGSTQQKRE